MDFLKKKVVLEKLLALLTLNMVLFFSLHFKAIEISLIAYTKLK